MAKEKDFPEWPGLAPGPFLYYPECHRGSGTQSRRQREWADVNGCRAPEFLVFLKMFGHQCLSRRAVLNQAACSTRKPGQYPAALSSKLIWHFGVFFSDGKFISLI